MAIYHCSIKIVKRSQGKSAVATPLTVVAKKSQMNGTEKFHDYTKKGVIVHAEILLPQNAPPTLLNRFELWNSVELFEKNSDAQLAREIEIALPVELDRKTQLELVRTYVNDTFVSVGVWRSAWSDYVNRSLEQNGIKERVDHRSYKRQGVEKIPSVYNEKQPEKASILDFLEQHRQDKPTSTYGKVKALKESAALFHFLQSNGINSVEELHKKIAAMQSDYYALRGEIVGAERDIATLVKHLEMLEQYRANKTPKTDSEQALLDSAVKYLDKLKTTDKER